MTDFAGKSTGSVKFNLINMDLSKETMIGNWIKYSENFIPVEAQDLIVMQRGSHSQYTPIELNDDVLDACGFKYDEVLVCWIERSTFFTLEPHTNEALECDGFIFPRLLGKQCVFVWLHDLQNFFKLVTGKQIIFNPQKLKK